jgi:hypothetical protein
MRSIRADLDFGDQRSQHDVKAVRREWYKRIWKSCVLA